jgi:hypothetical protein
MVARRGMNSKDQFSQENINPVEPQQKKVRPPPGGVATLAAEAAARRNQLTCAKDDANNGVEAQAQVSFRPSSFVGTASLAANTTRERFAGAKSVDMDGENDRSMDPSIPNHPEHHSGTEAGSKFCTNEVVSKGIAFQSTSDATGNYAQKASKERGNSKFLSSLSAYRKNKTKYQTKSQAQNADHIISDDASMPSNPKIQGEASSRSSASFVGTKEALGAPPPIEQPDTGLTSKDDTDHFATTSGRRDDSCGIVPLPKALGEGSESSGKFLEGRSSEESRVEVFRHHQGDFSAANLEESLEEQAIVSSGSDDTWNDGGGISDFFGLGAPCHPDK